MEIKKQLLFDKYIAKPIAYLLNFLVRMLGLILSIDHNLDREFKTIAICKFKGIGSIIQSTPMLSAIRKQYPNAQIIFVSTKGNQKILTQISDIDVVISVDDKNLFQFFISNLKALIRLIRIRPEVYLDLEIYSDYSTIFTLFTVSVNRVGFYLRSSSFRLGIYTHMMFFNPRVSISDVYLQLARLIGCNTEGASLYPLDKKENPSEKQKKNYLVINPNASDLRLERRWGKEKFVELIHFILRNFPHYDILLIGSASERTYTDEIVDEVNDERVKNTAGSTSINELIDLIAEARLMISNDTGPMHLAFSTKTPIVCLFGPCSPAQYGMSEYAYVIYKQVYCSPCVHDFIEPPCKGDNVCMKLIPVSEVVEKVKDVLNNSCENRIPFKESFIYKSEKNVLGRVVR